MNIAKSLLSDFDTALHSVVKMTKTTTASKNLSLDHDISL